MGALKLTYQQENPTLKVVWNSLKDKEKLCTGGYRFGFNGMEKDDEITGSTGSHYTAMFWEYDSRIGKRWNVDPVVKEFESPYATFGNNPIYFIDPNGDNKDGYTVDVDGNISSEPVNSEGGDEYDVLYVEDEYSEETRKNYDETGKKSGIQVEKGILTQDIGGKIKVKDGKKEKEINVSYYVLEKSKKSENLFEFVAKHTDIEWSLGEFTKNVDLLSTSYKEGTEYSFGLAYNFLRSKRNIKLIQHTHNHPNGTPPSGLYGSKKTGDYKAASSILKTSPKAVFRVYNPKKSEYYYYNNYGPTLAPIDVNGK